VHCRSILTREETGAGAVRCIAAAPSASRDADHSSNPFSGLLVTQGDDLRRSANLCQGDASAMSH
jgi:hypothetical protein